MTVFLNHGVEPEIPKEPTPPKMDGAVIELLTELCFGLDQPIVEAGASADAILIFGVRKEIHQYHCAEHFRDVQKLTGATHAYLTGGIPTTCTSTQALDIFEAIGAGSYPGVCFHVEQMSRCTRSNVRHALRIGLGTHARIAFIAKWHHCGRARLTLHASMPQAEIRHRGYPCTPGDHVAGIVTPEAWHHADPSRSLVWGEFLRIERYGSRGDIAYPDNVQDKVRRIRGLIGE